MKVSTLFLKVVILLIALVVLIALVRFPQTEGRAANLDLISIYADPLIIYGYIASIPFFMALYEAFKLLGYIERKKVFSLIAIKSLKKIKRYAFAIIGFLIIAILYIRVMAHGDDDPAGPTMVGLIAIFISLVVATTTEVLQRLLRNVIDRKK